jgi:hypothetical protein
MDTLEPAADSSTATRRAALAWGAPDEAATDRLLPQLAQLGTADAGLGGRLDQRVLGVGPWRATHTLH